MTEPLEKKLPHVSPWPVMLASSDEKVWQRFEFVDFRVSKEGFVDSTRIRLNIEQFFGPMKFRPAGKKSFSDLPIHPRLYFPREEVHGYWQGAQRGLRLLIEPEAIERLTHQSFRVDNFREIGDNDLVVTHLLSALSIDVRRHHVDGPLLGETILAAIIHHLLRDSLSSPRRVSGTDLSRRQFRSLKDWIDDNLEHSIKLTDLSTQCNVSVRHLSRMFQAETGLSPYNYVLHRRIERAKEMVQAGQLSLADIAESVGFANQAHMADIFRKLLGAPPSHFRKIVRMLPTSGSVPGQMKENVQNQEDDS